MKKNPFEILGIEPQRYDDNTLKQTYLALVRQYSPERYPDKFKKIRRAYDIIRNAKSPYEILSITTVSPVKKDLNKQEIIEIIEQKLGLSDNRLENKRKIIFNELAGGNCK